MRALLHCQPPSEPLSAVYSLLCCSFIGLTFVLSLYVFVPASTRRLPREDDRHVRARLVAVAIVTVFTTFVFFPLAFCSGVGPSYYTASSSQQYSFLEYQGLPNPSPALLLSPFTAFPPTPLLHTMLLFLGPLTHMSFQCYDLSSSGAPFSQSLLTVLVNSGLPPTFDLRAWPLQKVRDLLAAPLFEELCFRGSLVPFLLLSARYSGRLQTVIFVAPLFFGFAHVHHAIVGLNARQGEEAARRKFFASPPPHSSRPPPPARSLTSIFLPAAVQFTYTYLFGCYCVYGLLLTGRVSSVVLCHAFCNFMGLPDVSFWFNPSSSMRKWRKLIAAAYGLGIGLFITAFWHIGKGKAWGPGTALGAAAGS